MRNTVRFMLLATVLVGSRPALLAQDGPVVLREFDASGAGFSFMKGAVVQVFDPAKHQLVAPFSGVDFILDFPHGIGTNNSSLTPDFEGKAGVRDCGERTLGEVREAPGRGYKAALKVDEIKAGYTYCFVTADGRNYAKLHVIRIDLERKELEFSWQYQANGTRTFE